MTARGTRYFDATSLVVRPFHRKTGIERVEYELGERLRSRGFKLVWYDASKAEFQLIDDASYTRLKAYEKFDELFGAPQEHAPRFGMRSAIALAAARAYPYMPRSLGIHWHTERLALHQFLMSHRTMSPDERRKFAARMGMQPHSPLYRKLFFRAWANKTDGLICDGPPVSFSDGDSLVSCGIWMNYEQREVLHELKEEIRLEYVQMIHDLIPLRRPEFVPGSIGKFRSFVEDTLRHADVVTTNSQFVASDLEQYCRERELRHSRIQPVPLASERVNTPPTYTPKLAKLAFGSSGFALMVGTFAPRKNQAWLHQLWKRIVREFGDKAPALVFAGQLGWDYEETVEQIQSDDELWNKRVFLIEAPSDGELSWLYANCRFTLLPSNYEGWGLPIGESFSFGKYCLSANNSAMPEADKGLGFSASLDSFEPWIDEIRKIIMNPDYLHAREAAIKAVPNRTWDDVADEMFALCAGVRP